MVDTEEEQFDAEGHVAFGKAVNPITDDDQVEQEHNKLFDQSGHHIDTSDHEMQEIQDSQGHDAIDSRTQVDKKPLVQFADQIKPKDNEIEQKIQDQPDYETQRDNQVENIPDADEQHESNISIGLKTDSAKESDRIILGPIKGGLSQSTPLLESPLSMSESEIDESKQNEPPATKSKGHRQNKSGKPQESDPVEDMSDLDLSQNLQGNEPSSVDLTADEEQQSQESQSLDQSTIVITSLIGIAKGHVLSPMNNENSSGKPPRQPSNFQTAKKQEPEPEPEPEPDDSVIGYDARETKSEPLLWQRQETDEDQEPEVNIELGKRSAAPTKPLPPLVRGPPTDQFKNEKANDGDKQGANDVSIDAHEQAEWIQQLPTISINSPLPSGHIDDQIKNQLPVIVSEKLLEEITDDDEEQEGEYLTKMKETKVHDADNISDIDFQELAIGARMTRLHFDPIPAEGDAEEQETHELPMSDIEFQEIAIGARMTRLHFDPISPETDAEEQETHELPMSDIEFQEIAIGARMTRLHFDPIPPEGDAEEQETHELPKLASVEVFAKNIERRISESEAASKVCKLEEQSSADGYTLEQSEITTDQAKISNEVQPQDNNDEEEQIFPKLPVKPAAIKIEKDIATESDDQSKPSNTIGQEQTQEKDASPSLNEEEQALEDENRKNDALIAKLKEEHAALLKIIKEREQAAATKRIAQEYDEMTKAREDHQSTVQTIQRRLDQQWLIIDSLKLQLACLWDANDQEPAQEIKELEYNVENLHTKMTDAKSKIPDDLNQLTEQETKDLQMAIATNNETLQAMMTKIQDFTDTNPEKAQIIRTYLDDQQKRIESLQSKIEQQTEATKQKQNEGEQLRKKLQEQSQAMEALQIQLAKQAEETALSPDQQKVVNQLNELSQQAKRENEALIAAFGQENQLQQVILQQQNQLQQLVRQLLQLQLVDTLKAQDESIGGKANDEIQGITEQIEIKRSEIDLLQKKFDEQAKILQEQTERESELQEMVLSQQETIERLESMTLCLRKDDRMSLQEEQLIRFIQQQTEDVLKSLQSQINSSQVKLKAKKNQEKVQYDLINQQRHQLETLAQQVAKDQQEQEENQAELKQLQELLTNQNKQIQYLQDDQNSSQVIKSLENNLKDQIRVLESQYNREAGLQRDIGRYKAQVSALEENLAEQKETLMKQEQTTDEIQRLLNELSTIDIPGQLAAHTRKMEDIVAVNVANQTQQSKEIQELLQGIERLQKIFTSTEAQDVAIPASTTPVQQSSTNDNRSQLSGQATELLSLIKSQNEQLESLKNTINLTVDNETMPQQDQRGIIKEDSSNLQNQEGVIDVITTNLSTVMSEIGSIKEFAQKCESKISILEERAKQYQSQQAQQNLSVLNINPNVPSSGSPLPEPAIISDYSFRKGINVASDRQPDPRGDTDVTTITNPQKLFEPKWHKKRPATHLSADMMNSSYETKDGSFASPNSSLPPPLSSRIGAPIERESPLTQWTSPVRQQQTMRLSNSFLSPIVASKLPSPESRYNAQNQNWKEQYWYQTSQRMSQLQAKNEELSRRFNLRFGTFESQQSLGNDYWPMVPINRSYQYEATPISSVNWSPGSMTSRPAFSNRQMYALQHQSSNYPFMDENPILSHNYKERDMNTSVATRYYY